jgi:hypothetical protein
MNQIQRINCQIESLTLFELVWFIVNPNGGVMRIIEMSCLLMISHRTLGGLVVDRLESDICLRGSCVNLGMCRASRVVHTKLQASWILWSRLISTGSNTCIVSWHLICLVPVLSIRQRDPSSWTLSWLDPSNLYVLIWSVWGHSTKSWLAWFKPESRTKLN